jgi:EAL and modified HD-GYP domain-containing signal transduction protein
VPDPSRFPLVGLQAVANVHNTWVAVLLQIPSGADAGAASALASVFADGAALEALAPLDCIVPVADPRMLGPELLALLPPPRVILRIPAAACAGAPARAACRQLADARYRILLDGASDSEPVPAGVQGLAFDCSVAVPAPRQLLTLPGPHLARAIGSARRLAECRSAGFGWFAGGYAFAPQQRCGPVDDGASRKRLLALLGLLARDADARELEVVLKQDPVLSFHLLKLVNSAAFAPSMPINNFCQAINLLGRRQMQRWLQLLLYASGQGQGAASALLPLAAMRAAQMEKLCKLHGGDRDRQDVAFVAGAFSLLDTLLGMPMQEIVGTLSLDAEVVTALLERGGALGQMLTLAENHAVTESALSGAGIGSENYWDSLLQAYHWAILVSRNL